MASEREESPLSSRTIKLDEDAASMVEAFLLEEFGSIERAARRAGMDPDTLRKLLACKETYRSTRQSVFAVSRFRIDPHDLKKGSVPRVQTVLDRPPAGRDIPVLVQEFLDAPFFYLEMARLLRVHPESVRFLEKSEQVNVAKKLSDVAQAYNARGLYTDASRAYWASAVMYGLAGSYDDELIRSTQSLIAAWTFRTCGFDADVEDVFERQHRLVASRLELTRSVVGNSAAGLACGTFHFADEITAKLLQLALMLLPKESLTWPSSIVDPLLATKRRDAHLLGRQQRDAGLGVLKDIMAESKAGGSPVGSGNTAMCIACLLEEGLPQSKNKAALNRLIRFLTDPKNHFQEASTWVRAFSGYGLGRLYLARGERAKGSELIEKHLGEIRLHGFTPGRPMAERNKIFFSPEPLCDQEAKIFGSRAFNTRQDFPIAEEKLRGFINAVERRFDLHLN